jgi:hypothetical protein
MISQRFIVIVVTVSLIIVAAFTLRGAVVTSAVVSSGKDLSDYALRHPNAVIPVSTPDLSDYALRHPDARIVVGSTPDLSDYALRHPDARIVVESTPDLSDYALRHPELWRPATPDLSSPK